MYPFILRERIFDTACFIIGAAGRVLGFNLKQPVFIIGTGRCGTTLLVEILKSHSRLAGFPGEANEVWHPVLEPFDSTRINIPPIEVDPKKFTEVSVANWVEGHRGNIRDIFLGFHMLTGLSKVFFTKSAMVSFLIPEILEIFPDAKFIHIYRFGPSVVESYFKKNFGKYLRYKFAENEYRTYCANYWNACILEIDERNNELALEEKGQFLEFSYEELCVDSQSTLAHLANFLNVAQDGFTYDLSQISSQNYKVDDYRQTAESSVLLDVMSPGMKLKGYLSEIASV